MRAENWGQTKFLIPVSILMGLIAAWAVYQYLITAEQQLHDRMSVKYVERIVASQDLKKGERLELSGMALRDFPQEWVHPDALGAQELELLHGQFLKNDIGAGQIITLASVAKSNLYSLANRLHVDMRAMTVTVENDPSISALLTAGDLIDLYVTFDFQGKRLTALLLTAMKVLANNSELLMFDNQRALAGADTWSLTVEVSEADARKLVSAKQAGVITVSLNKGGKPGLLESSNIESPQGVAQSSAMDLADLLGLSNREEKSVSPIIIYGDRLEADAELSSLRKIMQGVGGVDNE